MSELLSRAGALFVAPAAAPARTSVVAPPPAGIAGVLASAEVLPAVAGGVAAALRSAHRARTALVLRPGDPPAPQPAFPAARALARRLAARELPAEPAGALVRVALPADPDAGVREAWRAITAAGSVPTIIALAARSDGYDALLAQTDALYVATSADLTDLALASLAVLGPPASRLAPPTSFIARRCATLGLTRLDLRPSEVHA